MCGICGVFSLDGDPVPDVVGAMNAAIFHRGPDEDGRFVDDRIALAMRRLSIIGVANGRQPIFNEDGNVAMVFNGEIYNYTALKEELLGRDHRFTTDSDGETIVHLYEELGDGLLDRLRGMFGLAVYDQGAGRLLLARDRPGKKPLYYAVHDGYLVFGSEIKAIHASGLIPKELDVESLYSYLAYGFVVGERTLFRHVRKLPAGHLLDAGGGRYEVRPYWDLPEATEPTDNFEQAAARLRELLTESVKKRLMSEVPLGAFLSGGVDSSAIVGIMAKEFGQDLQTFCVGFADSRYDELANAREVAEHFGTRHRELALKGCSPELLQTINRANDEPTGDSAAVPTYCVSRFARRHVTVVMTGEGGDETFAGYPHHQHCQSIEKLESRVPGMRSIARLLSSAQPLLGAALPARVQKAIWLAALDPRERVRGYLATFLDSELRRLLKPELQDFDRALAKAFEPYASEMRSGGALEQLLYVDARTSLADQLLMKVDKMGMAASLEARCPLLDQDLVEYAAALPTNYKLAAGESKLVLRRALEELVPQSILDRPKRGFDVPLDTWLLRDLQPLVTDLLLSAQAPLGRYLNLEVVRTQWRKFERTRETRIGRQLWRLINLAVWHELHWPSGAMVASDRASESEAIARLFVDVSSQARRS